MSRQHYILGSDPEELTRINLQARLFDAQSKPFLSRFIQPGQQVLEIGCGTGGATMIIAYLLEHKGHLTSIDRSENYVNYVQQRLEINDSNHVSVKCQTIENIRDEQQYDVIYGRAVLHHLPRVKEVISHLLRALKPNGLIAFEEPLMERAFTVPENAAYSKCFDLYIQYARKKEIEISVGRHLFHYFAGLGIKTEFSQFIQTGLITPEERSLMPRFLKVMSEEYIKGGFIGVEEMVDLQKQIEELTASDTLFGYTQLHQILGRKIA